MNSVEFLRQNKFGRSLTYVILMMKITTQTEKIAMERVLKNLRDL